MVGSRIRRVHLLKSDLRPRGESLGAATLPRFAVNLQNRFWVGIPYVEAGLTVNQVPEAQLVRLQRGPLYMGASEKRPRRAPGFLEKEN